MHDSQHMNETNNQFNFLGECKHIISGYLKCIKSNRGTNDEACRKLAKEYLTCRMDKYVQPIPECNTCAMTPSKLKRAEIAGA
jgi:hypothetical protein